MLSAAELVEQVCVPPPRGIPSISHPSGENNSNAPYSVVKTSITGMMCILDRDSSATPSTELRHHGKLSSACTLLNISARNRDCTRQCLPRAPRQIQLNSFTLPPIIKHKHTFHIRICCLCKTDESYCLTI